MIAADLLEKAARAAASARLLHSAGDGDGACNRAYYAMFDAARAALLLVGAPVEPRVAKTHNGLIAAFGQHLVRPGLIPLDMGRAFNRAAEIRIVADYTGDLVTDDLVGWLVDEADRFVAHISAAFPDADR